ncbi:HAD-IIB family hydrolase [Erysipelothrix sp. Poltava]|nr:HAD-IIB family hydrolase [Erysipelothrix sp. Poltava]
MLNSATQYTNNISKSIILGSLLSTISQAVDVDFVKITACSLNHTVSNFNEIVKESLDGHFNAVTAGAVWIDVMHSNVNKGFGIKHLLNALNIDAADIITFGDYHNDIQMLELAGRLLCSR